MGRKRIHYAWAICVACFWLFLCNMGLCSNILTVYLPFIEAEGLSAGMGSAILSVRALLSFLTTFFVEAFYRKLSLRRGILLASLAGAAAALVFSFGGGPLVYYLGAALAGIAYGAGCVYPVSLLLHQWFSARLGLAMGLSSAGSGLATMILSPLLSDLILKTSLRTAFLAQALFLALSALAVFAVVRDSPEAVGLEPYGGAGETGRNSLRASSRSLSRRMLWLLALMMLLNGGAGLAFSGHLSVLTITSGYDAATAATVVSLFGLTLMAGKLLSGWVSDRIGSRNASVLLIALFMLGCGCVLGMDGVHRLWYILMAVLLGLGAAVFNVGPPLWAAELSAEEQYAKTLRWLQIFYNLGAIVFTVVPGLIADWTGEYKSAYLLFAGMMASSMAILLYAYHQRKDQKDSGDP